MEEPLSPNKKARILVAVAAAESSVAQAEGRHHSGIDAAAGRRSETARPQAPRRHFFRLPINVMPTAPQQSVVRP